MNKMPSTALAIVACGSVAFAGSDSDEWLELDREVSSLASTLAPQGGGIEVGGLVISRYRSSSDISILLDPGPPAVTGDLGGFDLPDVDIWMEGSVGSYDYRVNFDLDSGTSTLEDAFALWNCNENFDVLIGQFKSPVLLSNSVFPEDQLFIDRSLGGALFDFWDQGLLAMFSQGQFDAFLAIQDGGDGDADDYAFSARGQFHVGNGATNNEGAFGATGDTDATVGIFVYEDGSDAVDGGVIGIDGAVVVSNFSVSGEVLDIDEDFAINTGYDTDEATPYSVTFSFMFVPDEWEAALRYQDRDDSNDTTEIALGVNWYRSGHNAWWHAGFSTIDSDAGDADVFSLGLVVGESTGTFAWWN